MSEVKEDHLERLVDLYKERGRQALEGVDIDQKHLRSNNLVINCNCSSCNDSKSIYPCTPVVLHQIHMYK